MDGADRGAARGSRTRAGARGCATPASGAARRRCSRSAVAGWAESGALRDPCAHPERQLAGVWDEGVKGRVRAAFLGTGRSLRRGDGDARARAARSLRRRLGRDAGRGVPCVPRRPAAPRDPRRCATPAWIGGAASSRRSPRCFAEKPDPRGPRQGGAGGRGALPRRLLRRHRGAHRARAPARGSGPARPRRGAPAARRPAGGAATRRASTRTASRSASRSSPRWRALPYPPLRAQVQFWVGRCGSDRRLRGGQGAAPRRRRLGGGGRGTTPRRAAWAELLVRRGGASASASRRPSVIRALGPTAVARARTTIGRRRPGSSRRGDRALSHGQVRRGQGRRGALPRPPREGARPRPPAIGVALNNLGIAALRDWATAPGQGRVERALAITEKALGPDHPDVAVSLNNLGDALRDAVGDIAEALAAYERALGHREKALGPDHPASPARSPTWATRSRRWRDFAGACASRARPRHQGEGAGAGPPRRRLRRSTASARAKVRLGQLDAAQPLLERARALREKPWASRPRRGRAAPRPRRAAPRAPGSRRGACRCWSAPSRSTTPSTRRPDPAHPRRGALAARPGPAAGPRARRGGPRGWERSAPPRAGPRRPLAGRAPARGRREGRLTAR